MHKYGTHPQEDSSKAVHLKNKSHYPLYRLRASKLTRCLIKRYTKLIKRDLKLRSLMNAA